LSPAFPTKFDLIARLETSEPIVQLKQVFFLIFVCLAVCISIPAKCAWGQESKGFFAALEPHKPILVAQSQRQAQTGTLGEWSGRELLLQFSAKGEIFAGLYFAYSHKAYWQVFDKANSRAFRETNYNPEVFWDLPNLGGVEWVRLGLWEHESNGEQTRYLPTGEPQNLSRTWNRVYLEAHQSFLDRTWEPGFKLWALTDQKDSNFGSYYQDNPDLLDYKGHGELYLAVNTKPLTAFFTFNRGKAGTETLRVQGFVPLRELGFPNLELFGQFFEGYGENLIDYNQKQRLVSLGLRFR